MQSKRFVFFSCICLLFIGIISYIPSFSGELFWDDDDFILNNEYVKQGSIDKFFSAQALEGAGKASNYFRPIQFSLYALIYQLAGPNPTAYHTASIIIHISASIVVFFTVSKLINFLTISDTQRAHPYIKPYQLIGFLIAIIFLIHPVQTEAVSYVSGVSDPLVVFFGLLSIYFYLKEEHDKLPISSLGFFVLALGSKESGLVFSGLIGFIWIFSFFSHKIRLQKTHIINLFRSFSIKILPYLAISLAYLLYHSTVIDVVDMKTIWGDHLYTHSVLIRLITFLQIFPQYLLVLIFPRTLFYDRDFSVTIPTTVWNFPSFLVLSILITLFISLLLLLKNNKKWLSPLFFFIGFFVTFLPFTGLILINGIMYEHFVYVPLIFFSGFVLVTLDVLLKDNQYATRYKKSQVLYTKILTISMVSILALYTVRSWQRQLEWRDEVILYTQTLQYVPQSFRVRNNLAMAYQTKGKNDLAIKEYQEVIRQNPSIPNPYHNLGNLYFIGKEYMLAEQHFLKAIEVDPTFGYSYSALLKLYHETGEQEKERAVTKLIEERFSKAE